MTRSRLYGFFTSLVVVLAIGLVLPQAMSAGDGLRALRLPAFPGAEGAGATTPGGRGGRVYVVTNHADHGLGTLREAVEANGPRIVAFGVAGDHHSRKPPAHQPPVSHTRRPDSARRRHLRPR